MAALAEDPAAAVLRVVKPVVVREGSRIDAHEQRRRRRSLELLSQANRERGEAAVEADHQQPAAGEGVLEALELFLVEGERLLDEDRLARVERRSGEARVARVARGDHDGVDRLVREELVRVRGRSLEAEARGDVGGGEAGLGRDRGELRPRVLQSGNQRRARECSGADEADADGSGARAPRRRRDDRARLAGLVRVFEHDPEGARLCVARQRVVRERGVLDGETVGRQRRRVDLSRRDELEKRREVPLLRPAHVGVGEVASALFVLAVVPARPVRPREP